MGVVGLPVPVAIGSAAAGRVFPADRHGKADRLGGVSQIEVMSVDAGFYEASGKCETCGWPSSSGGDSPFSAESGVRMQLRRHDELLHPELVEDVDEGDLELEP